MTEPGRHAWQDEHGRQESWRDEPDGGTYRWPEPPREDLRPPEGPWAEYTWADRDAGPVVRPYAMTGGRVVPASDKFDVVAMVVAAAGAAGGAGGWGLQPEHRAILAACREPLAVAELASHLDLALGVVRVLLGDLLGQGLIELYEPQSTGGLPSASVLKAVIHGLRAL
ncbi:DUF742 domain-containing protein [Dactylosporangium sp. CS-033363]|uniref:DUF742 domain-containing protein n=1 Tax=Dactylosporangium sp. CS-033363 TaxID=3239935 RepID=UPI003D936F90